MRKRKIWKPMIAAMLSAVMIAGNAGMMSLADSSNAGGKWTIEDGNRYYEVNGVKVTGIQEIGGKKYAFNEDGSLIKPERHNPNAGGQFMEIDGMERFVTFSGEIMPNRYWLYGQDPANESDAHWYYVDEDGNWLRDTIRGIDHDEQGDLKMYAFDEQGFMVTNELKEHNGYEMYFTNPEDGSAAKNKWMHLDDGWHLFHDGVPFVEGALEDVYVMPGLGGVTGSYSDGDKQYTFDSNGVLVSGNAPYGEVQSVQLGNGEDGESIEIEAGKSYKLPLSFVTSKPETGEANLALNQNLDMANELLVEPPINQNDETKPEESAAQESESEESAAQETQPEESTAPETQPEESTAQETQPEESTAQETQPEESTAQETQPEESTAQETQPEESTAQETQPEEPTAQETQPEESTAQETEPEQTTAQESNSDETAIQESTAEEVGAFSTFSINRRNSFSVAGTNENIADEAYSNEVVYTGRAVSDVLKRAYDYGLYTASMGADTPFCFFTQKVDSDGTISIKGNMAGTFTVHAEIDGISSNDVTITVKPPTSKSEAGEALKDLKDQNPEVALNQLRNMDKDALIGAVLTNKDDYQQIDNNYMFENNIVQEITVDPDLNEQFDINKLNVAGAALNADLNDSIEFKMTKPAADIDLSAISQPVKIPVDLTLNINDSELSSLEVPVLVTLPVPAGISPSRVGLYHIHDGQTQRMDVSVNSSDRTFSFATDGFSTFVVVENPSSSGGSSGGSGGSGSAGRVYGNSAKATAIPETPGSWNQLADGKWQFVNSSGQPYINTWVYAKGQWYWMDAAGIMMEGWQNINGKRYYLTPVSGAMVTGWYKDGNSWYYLDDTGAMKTGWVSVDNKWYYLGTDGVMLANAVTPDGYKVDASGAWVK